MCKRRERERTKTIVVIRLHSDELEKFWQGLGEFHLDPGFVWSLGTRWIETTNDVRVHLLHDLHGGIAENLPKCRSQTTCTWPLTGLENLFQTTNLGQTGALNAKSRRTKNSRSTENTYRAKERPATSITRKWHLYDAVTLEKNNVMTIFINQMQEESLILIFLLLAHAQTFDRCVGCARLRRLLPISQSPTAGQVERRLLERDCPNSDNSRTVKLKWVLFLMCKC